MIRYQPKWPRWFLLAAGLIVIHPSAGQGAASSLYVAPDGSDQNPGTLAKPFLTLPHARDAMRELRKQSPEQVTVFLRGGTYYLSEPLVFTADDSGTKDAPVTYAAFHEETPIISGGVLLKLAWRPYQKGIFQAEVPGAKEGKVTFDQLFIDGRRQHLARYPNYNPAARPYGGCAQDCVSPARIKGWSDPTTGFVHALHANAWGSMDYRITGVDSKGNAKLEGGWQNNRPTPPSGQRFVENIFEELDAPGEWFLDRSKGVLYLMPPAGADLDKARIEGACLKRLVDFRGSEEKPVRFLTLQGLTFTHAARTFMEPYEKVMRSDWSITRQAALFIEGAEDCHVQNCFFDAVGGNAIFVSNYNRRVDISGCKITEAGASGVCFVGDVNAARSPSFFGRKWPPMKEVDRTPGPKSNNYPAQCRVYDTLIHDIGEIEKQIAGVSIDLAEEVTVSHCSIYNTPRSGINIGDGCWGGHLIEFCDVFDTVRETGDHGSFNSWGRDRFWGRINGQAADNDKTATWDARKTNVICNSRWRCDNGWDIDLDDGSTNYHIYNNLCLRGGLKLREGFLRTAENNIMVGNSFHPHVWYPHSGDIFRYNIVSGPYQPIGLAAWGKEIDFNLFPDEKALAQSQRASGDKDKHSVAGDPEFIDPSTGDYRVKEGSPALALGFKNFPMDQFGVVSPALRVEAKTPLLPANAPVARQAGGRDATVQVWLGARIKNLIGLGEMSATSVGKEAGVLVLDVPANSAAAKAGLHKMDLILAVNGKATDTVQQLMKEYRGASKGKKTLSLVRSQNKIELEISK